jgi:2Fe-2S ferredoxin
MVKIVIENLAQKEVCSHNHSNTILTLLHAEQVDWMIACGGKGRCTTCKFIVVSGMEQLAPDTMAENKYRQTGQLLQNERLACQARLLGTCHIRVPDEYKLPHMVYTS